jgi:hydroxymethylpyrimidine/phosphomethylpyrimidine kinase
MQSANKVQTTTFSSETISTKNTHGTGCTLSSAITAFMARGVGLIEAIDASKRYVSEAIRAGADISIGNGLGPVNHGFNPLKMLVSEHQQL